MLENPHFVPDYLSASGGFENVLYLSQAPPLLTGSNVWHSKPQNGERYLATEGDFASYPIAMRF